MSKRGYWVVALLALGYCAAGSVALALLWQSADLAVLAILAIAACAGVALAASESDEGIG